MKKTCAIVLLMFVALPCFSFWVNKRLQRIMNSCVGKSKEELFRRFGSLYQLKQLGSDSSMVYYSATIYSFPAAIPFDRPINSNSGTAMDKIFLIDRRGIVSGWRLEEKYGTPLPGIRF